MKGGDLTEFVTLDPRFITQLLSEICKREVLASAKPLLEKLSHALELQWTIEQLAVLFLEIVNISGLGWPRLSSRSPTQWLRRDGEAHASHYAHVPAGSI